MPQITFKKESKPRLKGIELMEMIPFFTKKPDKENEMGYFTYSVFAETDIFLFEVCLN